MIDSKQPRTADVSFTEMTEIVLPQHANALGTVFGGQLMAWIDVCGAVAAHRHCGRIAVTAAVDDLVFHGPAKVGDIVRLTARLNAAFNTSVEVEVTVQVEDASISERSLCVRALMTFVAIDDNQNPCPVPPLQAQNEEEERRAKEARARRARRLANRSRKD